MKLGKSTSFMNQCLIKIHECSGWLIQRIDGKWKLNEKKNYLCHYFFEATYWIHGENLILLFKTGWLSFYNSNFLIFSLSFICFSDNVDVAYLYRYENFTPSISIFYIVIKVTRHYDWFKLTSHIILRGPFHFHSYSHSTPAAGAAPVNPLIIVPSRRVAFRRLVEFWLFFILHSQYIYS